MSVSVYTCMCMWAPCVYRGTCGYGTAEWNFFSLFTFTQDESSDQAQISRIVHQAWIIFTHRAFSIVSFLFVDSVTCSPCWPWTHNVAKAGFNLILCFCVYSCWNDGHHIQVFTTSFKGNLLTLRVHRRQMPWKGGALRRDQQQRIQLASSRTQIWRGRSNF